MKPRILILFDYDWDAQGLGAFADQYEFFHDGFDLFTFPDNAKLIRFRIENMVKRLLVEHQRRPFQAVLSNHEQFGALAAALFAQEAGLVGPSPKSIIACQHKLWMRHLLDEVAPQCNLEYRGLTCEIGEHPPVVNDLPKFVKPIKAAYSVLARTCNTQAELEALTLFSWHERWVIRRLVEPFDRLRRQYLPEAPSAHRMVLEEPVQGPQYNLDGYMYQGKAYLLGVVDELMYPDTQAFLRFHYPSSLPGAIQQRALQVAQALLGAAGFDNACFNMEFFYVAATDRLTVIEFNPRLGSQLADLYQRVTGQNIFELQLKLALGQDPRLVTGSATEFTESASFVFRCFNGQAPPVPPSAEQIARLKQLLPSALLLLFHKSAVGLAREYKWLGSHRYAVLHLEGKNGADLQRRFELACQTLGYPAGQQYLTSDPVT
jgi:ATP-grasp domain